MKVIPMRSAGGTTGTCANCGGNAHPGVNCIQAEVDRARGMTPTMVTRVFEADPGVVSFVEDLLERAKAGKLRTIAVACVYHNDLVPDGEADHGWTKTEGSVHWALDRAVHRLRYFWDKFSHED